METVGGPDGSSVNSVVLEADRPLRVRNTHTSRQSKRGGGTETLGNRRKGRRIQQSSLICSDPGR